jgi:hypothetical protein
VAARKLEESVKQVSERLLDIRAMSSGPHADAGMPRGRDQQGAAREAAPQPDTLDHKLAQLQKLIDSRSPHEARELADSLRKTILRPGVAHPLRKRGVAMIKQVYLHDGDKDALLAFTQDEVSSLDALIEAAGGNPLAVR